MTSSQTTAQKLSINVLYKNTGKIHVEYKIDSFYGEIIVSLPLKNQNPTDIVAFISPFVAIFLGQLCLANNIRILSPCSEPVIKALTNILRTLYAVRSCLDDFSEFIQPNIVIDRPVTSRPQFSRLAQSHQAQTAMLWSGGIDSTLALLLLQKNEYQVTPLHFQVNYGAVEAEKASVDALSETLRLYPLPVQIEFPEFIDIARKYSQQIGLFPLKNAIPHGREILLIPFAALLSLERGYENICLGHDYDTWSTTIRFNGEDFFRYDTQSRGCTIDLNKVLARCFGRLKIFSPIAALTEFRKFELFARRTELLSKCMSCYWGNWCGKCHKCARYYVYEKCLGINVIPFQNNPLNSTDSPLFGYFGNGLSVDYAMLNLTLQNPTSNQLVIREYRKHWYPKLINEFDLIKRNVYKDYGNDLLPAGFVYGEQI